MRPIVYLYGHPPYCYRNQQHMSDSLETQVLKYFEERNNRFRNSKGMELGLTAYKAIWTHYNLSNFNHGPIATDISTEEDGIDEFIAGFKLKAPEDIDNLEYTHSWMRYLNGYAEIDITPMELEATITFRIMHRRTMVYSRELHFYDEVYEHLTMHEDFENYLLSRERKLNLAAENRYKMNR